MMKRIGCAVLLAAASLATLPVMAVNVGRYADKDKFGDIRLSPNGDYYAATVPLEDRTMLVILRRADNKPTAQFQTEKNSHVSDFVWVNSERVLISIAKKFGELDEPQPTGEIFAINADGSQSEILVGYRVQGAGPGTRIQPKKSEAVAAFLVDELPADDRHVLVSVVPFAEEPYSQVDRLDIYTGRRMQVARAPVRRARFLTDNNGVVRFASGSGSDNIRKLYYRAGDGQEWQLIKDEVLDGLFEWPVGFSADNGTAYLETEHATGPNSLVAFDIATHTRKEILRDDDVDPAEIIYRSGSRIPLGAFFHDGRTRTGFIDKAGPEARLYRSLEASFPGQAVDVTSRTSDGRLALVEVWSDRNPGDFFLFDTVAKKAELLASRLDWVDPERMGEVRPVRLTARDGMALHGYLTLPPGSDGRNLPMVVLPHGGPFGIQDTWGFDSQNQMLAQAGYAVLQLNFRGSAGYGRSHYTAGARQWGGTMQDDLTDATRWAIKEGIADSGRICLYGGSYGAYASLMGVAKEPGLYRCAVGYVGVYDLPKVQADAARDSKRLGNWSQDWIGEGPALAGMSPNRIAERIKVPVFLAAGGEDEVAPIEHSRMMERALAKAGVPVETLYYDTEGHGFYVEKNRVEYYTRLLAFLSRHLGGKVASAGGGEATGAAR